MNHTGQHRLLRFLTVGVLSLAPVSVGALGLGPPAVAGALESSGVQCVSIDPESIAPRSGYSYVVSLDSVNVDEGDSIADTRRSRWVLVEDGRMLPRRYSLHRDIETLGQGRYSHWLGQLIFSTSDNSDPRANGRRYMLVNTQARDGSQIHFLGLGEPLVLRVGEMLWLSGASNLMFFSPTNGATRPNVNPEMPFRAEHTVRFSKAGEYYLNTTTGPVRALVLGLDAANWPESISLFVSANLAPGESDEPDWDHAQVNWPEVDRGLLTKLFASDRPILVRCGLAARLVEILAGDMGLKTRYISWLDSETGQGLHIGLEVFNSALNSWQYVDPNFGLNPGRGTSALAFWQSLQDENWAEQIKAAMTPAGRWEFDSRPEFDTPYQTYAQVYHAMLWWNNMQQTSGTVLIGSLPDESKKRIQARGSLRIVEGASGIEYVRQILYQSSNPWPVRPSSGSIPVNQTGSEP